MMAALCLRVVIQKLCLNQAMEENAFTGQLQLQTEFKASLQPVIME